MSNLQISKGNFLPLGLSKNNNGVNLAVCIKGDSPLFLIVYEHSTGKKIDKIEISKQYRFGNVYGIHIEGDKLNQYDYNFYQDMLFTDPYGRMIAGCEQWGKHAPRVSFAEAGKACGEAIISDGITEGFGMDLCPRLPVEEVVSYLIHVRGFTKHTSSKVKHRGTFEGVIEKLPYLNDLGINQIELMPAYEFDEEIKLIERGLPAYAMQSLKDLEVLKDETSQSDESQNDEEALNPKSSGRINYWGYSDNALYYAPKAAYAASKNPSASFERMIMACHDLGMEVILQFYFSADTRSEAVLDVLRFWTLRYHVDGFRVMGSGISDTMICQDPFLSGVKLYLDHMPDQMDHANLLYDGKRHVALCQDDFSCLSRRFLKSDEDMLSAFSGAMIRNNPCYGVRNCICDYHGFTLSDLVSYERKHNEDNGEDNHDGTDYNFSWNCGFEGKTRKKLVLSLRKKQVNNILTFLYLSAGIPVLRMGDEFGNSQKGNNNAYCQDNEISWLDWSLLSKNQELHQFVKHLIAFRREHSIFKMGRPYAMVDRTGCGYPDLSFHGTQAWLPQFENYNRHFGMMLVDGGEFLYGAFNMYWNTNRFALPNLPKGMKWAVIMDTEKGFYNVPKVCENQEEICVLERSCCILKAIREKTEKNEKAEKTEKTEKNEKAIKTIKEKVG